MSTQNPPERRSEAGSGPSEKQAGDPLERLGPLAAGNLPKAARVLRGGPLGIVTVAAILAAALLAASEFLDLYKIVTPSGGLVAGATATQTGGDHHSYALLVVALA